MRGGYKHNLLVEAILRTERARGAIVYPEYRASTPMLDGYLDLLAVTKSRRRAYEVENNLDRVRWDITKAIAFKIDELVLVFPTGCLARAAQKSVDQLRASGKVVKLSIVCLTAGAALERITNTPGVEAETVGSSNGKDG